MIDVCIAADVEHVKMSISAVWGAGVKEDSEKFSEMKELPSVTVTDYAAPSP